MITNAMRGKELPLNGRANTLLILNSSVEPEAAKIAVRIGAMTNAEYKEFYEKLQSNEDVRRLYLNKNRKQRDIVSILYGAIKEILK